jgi:hypothetical protein
MNVVTPDGAQTVGSAYAHTDYAGSLVEFGKPSPLVRSGGWVLERAIPNTSFKDAMGCYPLFSCPDWSNLPADLRSLKEDDLVSLSLVADPFGGYTAGDLKKCFNAKVIPYKEHFVVDLSRSMSTSITSHHRRYARKGLRELVVEYAAEPDRCIEQWVELYRHLIARHGIKGISAFSSGSLAKQLTVPGMHVFRACERSTVIGMVLWYAQGAVGYYHLGAYSPRGYELRASFPLFWSAIEYFAERKLRWLDLGAGAGVSSDGKDGLSAFKKGWSSGTRPAYFCGHIFNHRAYNSLLALRGMRQTDYFPAYRYGEFA